MTIPYSTTNKRQPLGYFPKRASARWWVLVRHSGESTLRPLLTVQLLLYCTLNLSELEISCLRACFALTRPFPLSTFDCLRSLTCPAVASAPPTTAVNNYRFRLSSLLSLNKHHNMSAEQPTEAPPADGSLTDRVSKPEGSEPAGTTPFADY